MRRGITEELLKWKASSQRKPLIIRGARQIGKTYSLLDFAENYFPNYHYINFEKNKSIHKAFDSNLDPQNIINLISIELDSKINKEDLLIFDEIQAKPEAITALKYFSEDMPELAVCAAGSLLGLKFNDLSFPVGKVDYLDMFPLTFFEFLQAIDKTNLLEYIDVSLDKLHEIPELVHEKLWLELKNYFIVGGLPEAVLAYKDLKDSPLEAFRQVREVQKKIIFTYLDDMTKHSGKENAMHIERLWQNIPSQLASNQDATAPKFRFKDIIPGIKAYSRLVNVIDWLEATGLIIKVKIVSRAQKPLISFTKENRFKLFVFDTGILGALSELSAKDILDYDFGTYKGYFAENFVAQELRAKNGIKANLYSWDEGSAEIEFLRQTDEGIIPVEVKSGWLTRAKSLQSFIERYQPHYSIILSARNYSLDCDRRTHYVPLYLANIS